MRNPQLARHAKHWLAILALILISAAAYLPMTAHMGYTGDDWYEMYDARVAGPQFFHTVFSSDRPARAYLQIPLYGLFGENLVPYHLTMYFFRLAGALALFWIVAMVWPKRRSANFAIALLFALYPGFLSMVDAIDFQAHLLSLCLAMLSIALSLKAILVRDLRLKIVLTAASVLLGWSYLALMEYFIGMEVFRFMCLFVMCGREASSAIPARLGRAIRAWFPFALIPLGFMGWRLLYFSGARRATDVSFQVGQLVASPLHTGISWLVTLAQDAFKVIFLAWGVPLYDLAFALRLRVFLLGLGLAAVLAILAAYMLRRLQRQEAESDTDTVWRNEALLIGFLSVLGGLLPVVVANRHVDFASYSRYSIPGMAAGVMLVVAFVDWVSSPRLRVGTLALLTTVAVLTHFANAINAVGATEQIRSFWWQVSWRVPQIKDGTTLAASYAHENPPEDYFIWGPANFIYSPGKQDTIPLQIRVPAVILGDPEVLQILAGKGTNSFDRRGNLSVQDSGNVLVIVQSVPGGCVRVIDGANPELSTGDPQNVMLVASHSRMSDIVPDAPPSRVPVTIFGSEPRHDWCYYYEKASLARQRADWALVVKLGDQALAEGWYPEDRVEWMPFLQAYIALGKQDRIQQVARIINADSFLRLQACRISAATTAASADLESYVHRAFCE